MIAAAANDSSDDDGAAQVALNPHLYYHDGEEYTTTTTTTPAERSISDCVPLIFLPASKPAFLHRYLYRRRLINDAACLLLLPPFRFPNRTLLLRYDDRMSTTCTAVSYSLPFFFSCTRSQ